MAHLPVSCAPSRLRVLAGCLLALAASQLQAQDGVAAEPLQAELEAELEAYAPRMNEVADALWNWAEPGYLETRSSGLLQEELREAGFQVQGDVAGMPTAFVAHAGSGGPVIALLAEMDALPGMSQAAEPVQRSVEGAVLSIRAGTADQANRALSALLAAGIELSDFTMGQPSLDEVFFALTGGATDAERNPE